jgi:hypothetical protein
MRGDGKLSGAARALRTLAATTLAALVSLPGLLHA